MANHTFLDLTGTRYGRLVVQHTCQRPKNRPSSLGKWWVCRCDCGTIIETSARHLRDGHTASCGCLQRERSSATARKPKKHGDCTSGISKEYHAWAGMIERCTNRNYSLYRRYGGRGISVCQEWKDSFSAFLAHVGRAPTKRHSLDRIDNDGNYEPGNVRWATPSQQTKNSCRARLLTYDGITMNLGDWAAKTGINQATIRMRIDAYGWSVERALTTPVA